MGRIEELKKEIEKAKEERDYWKYKYLSKELRILIRDINGSTD